MLVRVFRLIVLTVVGGTVGTPLESLPQGPGGVLPLVVQSLRCPFGSVMALPVDVAWERILEAGGTEFTDQVEQVLYEDADRIETDLHALMAQAQVLSPAVHITDHVRGSKRCFAVPSSGSMGNRDVNVGIGEKGWPGGGLVLFGGAKNENLHAIVRVKPLKDGKKDICLWGLGTLVGWGLQKGKILRVN